MRLLRDDRGQTLVVTGLALTCLLGMAGFSVDIGMMFRAKRILQAAADAGAIAGAAEVNYNDATSSAKAATAQNGMTDGSGGVTVTVNNPPATGPNTTNSTAVEVIVAKSVPTYFMKIFHISTMTVKARAVAGLLAGNGCIFTLDPSGVDVGLTGTGEIDMPDCGIMVNSASSNAVNTTGSSTIIAQSIGIVGSYHDTGTSTVNPTPISGIAPVADPLSFLSPPTYNPATCLADPKVTGSGTTTLGPATSGGTVCYNGISISGSGTVTFQPGTYIVNGSMNCSGSTNISGSNVTFYLAPPNGAVSLTGSGTYNLSAPTTGTYNGILFYEDPSDTNTLKMTGSTTSTIEGIYYAPDASMSFTGSSGATIYADMVVHALSMTGTSNVSSYADVNKNSPLTVPKLIE